MKIWIVEISDFVPIIDKNQRLYRAGMLAKALVEKGHHVLWWTSTFNHQFRRQRFEVSKTIDIQENYQIRLLYGPGYKRSVSFERVKHNRITARELHREGNIRIKHKKPDIIYTCIPTLEVSEMGVHLAVRNSIPVVVDIRELWPDNYLLYFPRLIRPVARLFLKKEFACAHRIMSQASGIIGSSDTYVNWGLRVAGRKARLSDKSFLLGTYIKAEKGNHASSDIQLTSFIKDVVIGHDTVVVTYAGTFGHLYDFRTVMSVASELSQAGEKRLQFLFVGDSGAQASFLHRCSEKYNNVHMTGWVDGAMVKRLLHLSSVGLAPYAPVVAAPTLPNKPFEYMAAGLPILSSIEGELRTIVEENAIGLQYKAGAVSDLKKKIMWFVSHPEERKKMGVRARALLEQEFDADVVYGNLVGHLKAIVDN